MGKFLMRCIKRTVSEIEPGCRDATTIDRRVAFFKKLWRFAYTTHYVQEQCCQECPCNQHYGNDSVDECDDNEPGSSQSSSDQYQSHDQLSSSGNSIESMSDDLSDDPFGTVLDKHGVVMSPTPFNALNQTTTTTSCFVDSLPTKEDYMSKKGAKLTELCKKRGLKSSGTKAELTGRLIKWDQYDRELQESQPDNPIAELVVGPRALALRQNSIADPNIKPRIMPKKIFDLRKEKHREVWKKIVPIMKTVEETIASVLHGVNTCGSESINFVRLSHCPKHRFFARSYGLRSMTSIHISNFGMEQTYNLFCKELNIEPKARILKQTQVDDNRKKKDHIRKSSMAFKLQTKECRASRLCELKLENQADAEARERNGFTHTYHTNRLPSNPPPACLFDDEVAKEDWNALYKLKNKQLRTMCKERGLRYSGNKQPMVKLLVEWGLENPEKKLKQPFVNN